LTALIAADVTLPFVVTRGVLPTALEGLDCGATRSFRDAEAVLGVKRSCRFAPALLGIYTIEQRRADVRARLFSKSFLRDAAPRYGDAINFVLAEGCSPRAVFTGAVSGVLARAFFSQDTERLRELITVLRTGLTRGAADVAAVLFRNWALTHRTTGARVYREAAYRKCESAAAAFFESRPIGLLVQSSTEKFPLPAGLSPFEPGDIGWPG
jgi:hypothetical protein